MKLKKRHFEILKDIAEKLNHELNYSGLLLSDLIADIESVQKQNEEHTLINIDQLRKDMEEQKVETVQEEPISPSELAIKRACDKHRKSVEDNIQKELDTSPIHQAIKSGLKRQKEAIDNAKDNIANEYGWDKNPLGVDAKRVKVVDIESPISTAGFVGNIEFTGNIFNDSVRHEFAKNYIRQGESMVAASSDKSTGFKGGLRSAVEALDNPKIGDVGYFRPSIPNEPIVYGKIRDCSKYIFQETSGHWYVGFSKTPPELK
jgi:hypothetical protein